MRGNDYKTMVNDLLVEIFFDVQKLEQKAIASLTPTPLTMSEMHILEAVGKSSGLQMGEVARRLRITLPTLTVSVNRLVEKGFLDRKRSREDRRRVEIALTENGLAAYEAHERFHSNLVQSMFEELDLEHRPALLEGLSLLDRFFRDLAQDQAGRKALPGEMPSEP